MKRQISIPHGESAECRTTPVIRVYSRLFPPPKVRLSFAPGSSMTKQSFKEECDINNVVARFVRTGALSPDDLTKREMMFADVSDVGDLQDSLERVRSAEAGFMTLPAKVRERFNNNPAELLLFLSDKSNAAEAAELGLTGPASTSSAAPGPAPAPGAGKGSTQGT